MMKLQRTAAPLVVALFLIFCMTTASAQEALPEEEAIIQIQDIQQPPRSQTRHRLTMMITGHIDGNFARVNCREEHGYSALYWARRASYFDTLNALSQSPSISSPIALNIGGSIFPGALARHLLGMEKAGAHNLASILAQAPVDVHGLGYREFSAPRDSLINVIESLQEQGIDTQAANLVCDPYEGAEAICDALDQRNFRVIERDGLRLAVATVLAEDLLDSLAASQRQGLRLLSPAAFLPNLIQQMRQEADLVLIQYQLSSHNALQTAYDLASQVPGIDLMIAGHLLDGESVNSESVNSESEKNSTERPPENNRRMAVIQTESSGTSIISGNSSERDLISVDLEIAAPLSDDQQWSITSVTPRRIHLYDMPDHPATTQLLRDNIDTFCNDWGEPLGDFAHLAEPFSMPDLQLLILNIMRFSTRSELALFNRQAFRDEGQFPLTEQLTAADIYIALPYANRLVTTYIKGSRLKAIAPRLRNDLVGAGITIDDTDRVLINGRPVIDDHLYRVALNDYLAEGGDNVFAEADLSQHRTHHPHWSPDPPTIDELAIHYIRSEEHIQRGDTRDAVSAEGNFPDLHRKFLWTFTGALNTSYNQVTVQNPVVGEAPGYDQSQLGVQSTDQINLEGRLTSQADSRNHRWNNDLNLQYATARVSDVEDAFFDKTRDLIRYRSRYRYQRWRAHYEGIWYVPDPLVEGQLETEFNSPETRDWHRVDLRAITGFSFQLLDPLDLRIGANIRQDINQPDSQATWGINAGYTLARVNLLNLLGRPIQFESEVEYFYNDIAITNIHELRSANRVFFAVFDSFFFTTTFNAFAYRNDPIGEFGTNTELTVGLNYQWDAASQRF